MKFLVTSHINYKYIKKHSEQFNGCINAGISIKSFEDVMPKLTIKRGMHIYIH